MNEIYDREPGSSPQELVSYLKKEYPGFYYRVCGGFLNYDITIDTHGVTYKIVFGSFEKFKIVIDDYTYYRRNTFKDYLLRMHRSFTQTIYSLAELKRRLSSELASRFEELEAEIKKPKRCDNNNCINYYSRYIVDKSLKETNLDVLRGNATYEISLFEEDSLLTREDSIADAMRVFYCLASQDLNNKYINLSIESYKAYDYLLFYLRVSKGFDTLTVGYVDHVLTLKICDKEGKSKLRIRLMDTLVLDVELYSYLTESYVSSGYNFFTGNQLYNYI